LIVAGPAVVQADLVADRGTHLGHKTDPAVRAGPCTPPVLNPGELPAPADGPVSAPHVLVSVPALDLAHLGQVSVVQVA
jgi:hypothetical protein